MDAVVLQFLASDGRDLLTAYIPHLNLASCTAHLLHQVDSLVAPRAPGYKDFNLSLSHFITLKVVFTLNLEPSFKVKGEAKLRFGMTIYQTPLTL